MADENTEKAFEAIAMAKVSGKIKKGANEATKAIERGVAKLVVYAKDVQPQEVIMHIPLLAKEHSVPCIAVNSKEELGDAAGVGRPTAAIAVVEEGDAKKLIEQLKEA